MDPDSNLRARRARRSAQAFEHEVATTRTPAVPGRSTRVPVEPGSLEHAIDEALVRAAAILAPLASANEARDARASAEHAAMLAATLRDAALAANQLGGERSARVGAMIERAEPLIAAAFVPSRAALDEGIAWGSATRVVWDRDVAAWKATSARSREQVAARGVERATEVLPHVDRIQAAFGRHDIAGVRVATDSSAVAAASSLGARAFAFGERIAFAAPADVHTAAHEAAHVVQQRGTLDGDTEAHADAVADLVVRGESAEHLLDRVAISSSPIARLHLKNIGAPPQPGIDARDYVQRHRAVLMNAIANRIIDASVPEPHPRLAWRSHEEGARAVANQIRAYVDDAPADVLGRLAMLVQPADLVALVDVAVHRPGGVAPVALAIAAAFDQPIVEAIARVGARIRARMDALNKTVDPSVVVTSAPLDRVVREAMRGRVDGNALKHGQQAEARGRALVDGVREVEYKWLGSQNAELWNWIVVTSPKDATAEDVATTPLAGGNSTGTEQAYRIAASPPYFGIPFETARLVPEAIKYAPEAVRARVEHDPGPRFADPSVLAGTTESDGAATAQAPKATAADLEPAHALARLELELAAVQTALAPYHADHPLGAAVAFVGRRRDELARSPSRGAHWAAVLSAQERVVNVAAADVVALTSGKPNPSPHDPIVPTLHAYARAIGVSHLAAQALPALGEARRMRALSPLADVDQRIEAARTADAKADPLVALDLATRAADLRARAEREGKIDRRAVDALAVEADEAALGAHLGSLERTIGELAQTADEAGVTERNYEHGLPTLRFASSVLRARMAGWRDQLAAAKKFKGPTPGHAGEDAVLAQRRAAIGHVVEALASTARELELDKYVKWAQEAIQNKLLVQRIVRLVGRLAAEIALMIASMQFASAAVTAVRGVMAGLEIVEDVRGASLAVRVATSLVAAGAQTVGQGAIGGEVSWRAFAENAIALGATAAITSPFEGLLAESAALENDLRTLAQRAVRAGAGLALEAGASFAGSALAQTAVHGSAVGPTSTDVLEQGFALLVGRLVHARAGAMTERLDAAAATLGKQTVATLRAKVEQLAERARRKAPTDDEALGLLRDRASLLREERALYQGHPELERTATHEPELGGAFAEVPLVLAHLEPVLAGRAYLGTRVEIDRAITALGASGLHPEMLPQTTPGTRRVRFGERTIELRERGTPAAPVEAPHAKPPENPSHFTPADRVHLAELAKLRQELAGARAANPNSARATELATKIEALERALGIRDASPARRRAVEVQLEILADAPRREQLRRALGGDKGHPGIELHSHFMAVVPAEVYRQRAATAGGAHDAGSWQPLLDKIADLPRLEAAANAAAGKADAVSELRHTQDASRITHRAKAGDAVRIAIESRLQVNVLKQRAADQKNPPADRAAYQRAAEAVAEEACRTALSATAETSFDGAYVIIEGLVQTTFGGATRAGETGQQAEQRAYDDFIREAILELARTGTAYSEQSTGVNKLDRKVHPDRIQAVLDQLIAEGLVRPGQVEIKMLGMVTTRHYGERDPQLPPVEGGDRSGAKHQAQNAQALRQTDHPGTIGRDIGAPEAYTFDAVGKDRYKADYVALRAKAIATGHVLLDRPHVGEGSIDTEPGKPFSTDKDRVIADGEPAHYARARANLDLLLDAAEELRAKGVWDPVHVITRYGHAAHATPRQAARMRELGIIDEVNLGSNVATGSISQTEGPHGARARTERFDDHALATALYYDVATVLSTDGPMVMTTSLAAEYARAHHVVEAVLAGEQPIRISRADATVAGTVRGVDVANVPDARALYIDELTAAERVRFLNGYEKLFRDAERYYLRRPKPGARSATAPLGGAHHTTIAIDHGLVSRRGEALYAGSPKAVRETAAAYRRAGYRVLGDETAASIELVVASADDGFTTTLVAGDEIDPVPYTHGGSR